MKVSWHYSVWIFLAVWLLFLFELHAAFTSRHYGPYRNTDRYSSSVIPTYLIPCYRFPNGSLRERQFRIPQTMANFIDLVHQIERQRGFNMDLRVVTTSLLHRFRIDGLERDPYVDLAPGVTPFRPTGVQYPRYKVLLGKLLPGSSVLFPNASLSTFYQCAMHQMLSNTVDPWERGDESSICPKQVTPRGRLPPVVEGPWSRFGPELRPYPDPVLDIGPWGGVNASALPPASDSVVARSACPIEEGAVEVSETMGGGAVTPGIVLAGLAAGLEPQKVPLANLLTPPYLERLRADGGKESATVSNLWAATLAGDLAEVALYQGPLQKPTGVLLGPEGEWDDPLVPRTRYLSRERPGSPELAPVTHWDMTDAEIRAGFDGLALGSRIASWTRRMQRLRLSQVLDMYYSPRGVAFEQNIRACERSQAVKGILTSDKLLTQSAVFGRMLSAFSTEAPYLAEAALKNFTASAVRAFQKYGSSLVSTDSCPSDIPDEIRVNLLTVLDATWNPEQAFRAISALASGADVSHFGSRIGVLSGNERGKWIANFTDSTVELALVWSRIDRSRWPTHLDLPWALVTALRHIQRQTEFESRRGAVGSLRGNVVAFIALTGTISDVDMRHAKQLIRKLKILSPDTILLYIVQEVNQQRFQELANLDPRNDVVVVVNDNSAEAVADRILGELQQVTGYLLPPECVLASARLTTPDWPVELGALMQLPRRLVRGELEDYATPGQLRVFRIHPAYFRSYRPVQVDVVGAGYGDLQVCMIRGPGPDPLKKALQDPIDPPEPHGGEVPQLNCTDIMNLGQGSVSLSRPCADSCAPIFLMIRVNKTFFKCSEEDCRYPDQVRFVLRPKGLSCIGDEEERGNAGPQGNPAYKYSCSVFNVLFSLLLLNVLMGWIPI